MAEGALPEGIAADNCVAVHYEGAAVKAIIASTPTARAYRLEKPPSGYRETETVPVYLG